MKLKILLICLFMAVFPLVSCESSSENQKHISYRNVTEQNRTDTDTGNNHSDTCTDHDHSDALPI